jgi:hypothetical protein
VSGPGDSYATVTSLIAAQPVLVTDLEGAGGRLRRLCGAAAGALSARGVGVGVLERDGLHGVSAGSDPATERLEDLQFLLGEGPCIDAVAARRPVLVANLDEAAMRRWPGYGPAVRDLGIGAVFAFPLQVGAARLGAMDVFRTAPGPLSLEELRFALLFAVVAVNTLLDGQDKAPDGSVGGLEDQVTHGAELFQAQGMVMAELGVSITEAMVRIRAYTFAENRRLPEVATDIVHGRLHLDR